MRITYLLSFLGLLSRVSALPSVITTAATAQVSGSYNPDNSFNPFTYVKTFVQCPAVERDPSTGETVENIFLRLGYLDINPKGTKTIVMLHGWPSLWTTYRNQIQAFGKEYRLIVVEHRGFGTSEHPKDLFASNTMFDVSN